MASDKDEIIHEQSEEIEDLREELSQVYAELDVKQKRKAKHGVDPRNVPVYLMLIWWHFFNPAQLRKFLRDERRRVESHAVWQLTAALIYFPLVLSALGFALGSLPVAVNLLVRLGVGAVLLAVMGIGWRNTAGLSSHRQPVTGHVIRLALINGTLITFTIGLIVLSMNTTLSCIWPLLLPGIMLVINAGLRTSILTKMVISVGPVDRFNRRGLFNDPLLIAATMLLAGSVMALIVNINMIVMLVYVLGTFAFALPVFILVHVTGSAFAHFFGHEFKWGVASDDERVDARDMVLTLEQWFVLVVWIMMAVLYCLMIIVTLFSGYFWDIVS